MSKVLLSSYETILLKILIKSNRFIKTEACSSLLTSCYMGRSRAYVLYA